MPRRGRTEEQIIATLRQAESGVAVKEVCRQAGISENTFYTRKRKYAGIGVSELRKLRQLREENARLKRLAADLNLDKCKGQGRVSLLRDRARCLPGAGNLPRGLSSGARARRGFLARRSSCRKASAGSEPFLHSRPAAWPRHPCSPT